MAYVRNNAPASPRPATAGSKPAANADRYIFQTGLFAPNKEGVKAIGNVQVKEDITIPAGSYLNLYEADQKTPGKGPVFRVTVTKGSLKSAQA